MMVYAFPPVALLLVSDGDESATTDSVLECYLETVQRIVGWCRTVSIRKLTAYDHDGTAISTCLARVTNINS